MVNFYLLNTNHVAHQMSGKMNDIYYYYTNSS